MSVKDLLDFIAEPESGGDYNIDWGGIKAKDAPPKPLTSMTIGEVLAWQDSIDPYYRSEAAGRYQILEDTLRGLYRSAGMRLSDLFDEEGQDRLATQLLNRRGLKEYLAGRMTVDQFCNSLAKEWASLPVASPVNRKGRVIQPGYSYYSGDGLNKSHVSVEAFRGAVKAAKLNPERSRMEQNPWSRVIQAILSFFTGGKNG